MAGHGGRQRPLTRADPIYTDRIAVRDDIRSTTRSRRFPPTFDHALPPEVSDAWESDTGSLVGSEPFPVVQIGANVLQTDSRHDPRVRLADLMAGVGAWVATKALGGTFSEEVAQRIRPYLIEDSIWGDLTSWSRLMAHLRD